MPAYPDSVRVTALTLLSHGLTLKQVQQRLPDPAPCTATLAHWRDTSQHASNRGRHYPAEVIGQVVANLIVTGSTRSAITQETGIGESSQRHWLTRFAPTAEDGIDLTDFQAVVAATMDNVNNSKRSARKKTMDAAQQRRTNAPDPVFPTPPTSPGSETSTDTGSQVSSDSAPATPSPALNPSELPDDPAELKKMLMEERTRRAIAEGHLIMLGKGLVPANSRDVADLICYLRAFGHQLRWLLSVTDLARSTFHRWAHQLIRPVPDPTVGITDQITHIASRAAQETNGGRHFVYGYRKIHQALAAHGCRVSEKIIRRHMRAHGLNPTRRATTRYSSYQGENEHRPAHLLLVQDNGSLPDTAGGFSQAYHRHRHAHPEAPMAHDFHADRPHQRLVTDISEFTCRDGKVYLSPLIDLYDGLPVSVAVSTSPSMPLVISMLHDGLAQLPAGACPIIHTDRGFQYRAHAWRDAATSTGADGECVTRFIPSMSRKARSGDNAVAEGFFGTLTREVFARKRATESMTRAEVIAVLDNYIDWYVWGRINARVGYRTLAAHRGWDPQPHNTIAA